MEIVPIIIGVVALVGVVVAIIEWRGKTVFLKHDLNLNDRVETEADRQLMRTLHEMRGRDSAAGSLNND